MKLPFRKICILGCNVEQVGTIARMLSTVNMKITSYDWKKIEFSKPEEHEKCDLLLLSWNQDGFQEIGIVQKLKDKFCQKNGIVIAVCNLTKSEIAIQAMEEGADSFVFWYRIEESLFPTLFSLIGQLSSVRKCSPGDGIRDLILKLNNCRHDLVNAYSILEGNLRLLEDKREDLAGDKHLGGALNGLNRMQSALAEMGNLRDLGEQSLSDPPSE